MWRRRNSVLLNFENFPRVSVCYLEILLARDGSCSRALRI